MDKSNVGQILMEKLRTCPSTGDAMKGTMNDVFNILKNYEGEIEDLPYFSTLYTKHLLEEYSPKEIHMYLNPLLQLYKKYLDLDLLHHVGEHILVELSSNIHDLTKEQLLLHYIEMLNIGKTKNITLNTIFPLTEMTLYKFLDYAFVCKAKLLQRILLQVIHLLLPRLTKHDVIKFIPYNEAMQVALRKFSCTPFEEVVTFFLNCLNSKTEEVFLLETMYISIGRNQYGKDEKDRTFVEFNCTKRKLTIRVTPHDDIHRRGITLEIQSDNIDKIFIKEFTRILVGEIYVYLEKPVEIASLSHKMKKFSFRFNIMFLQELSTFIGDSFIDRFFGGFKMFKTEPPTFTKPYSDISKFKSHSSANVCGSSDSTLNQTYLQHKETILSTSQNIKNASLASNNTVSYTTFHANCTSTPEKSDRRTIANETIIDLTNQITQETTTSNVKQERIKKMPAHLNNALLPVSFTSLCHSDRMCDKECMSNVSSDLEALEDMQNNAKPVVKDSNLNIWVSPPQLNTSHFLVLSPKAELESYVLCQSDTEPEIFYSLNSQSIIHASVVDKPEIQPSIYQKNNAITNFVETEETDQFYSANIENNEPAVVDDLIDCPITYEIREIGIFPEVIELKNGLQIQSGILNTVLIDKKRERVQDKIVSPAKKFKLNESVSVEFSDESILQKSNLYESNDMMPDITLQSDLQLILSPITINDTDSNQSQVNLSISEIEEIGQILKINTESHSLQTTTADTFEHLKDPKHCKLTDYKQTMNLSNSSMQSINRPVSSKLRLKKFRTTGPAECDEINSRSIPCNKENIDKSCVQSLNRLVSSKLRLKKSRFTEPSNCNKENIGVKIQKSSTKKSKPASGSKAVFKLSNNRECNSQLFSSSGEHQELQVLPSLEEGSMIFREGTGIKKLMESKACQDTASSSVFYTLQESPILSSSQLQLQSDVEKFIDAEDNPLSPVISTASEVRNRELAIQNLSEASINELMLPAVQNRNTPSIVSMDLEESVGGQIIITDCVIGEGIVDAVPNAKNLELTIIQDKSVPNEFSSNLSQIDTSKESKGKNKDTNNSDNEHSEDIVSYQRFAKICSSSEYNIDSFENNQDDTMLSPDSKSNTTNEILPLLPLVRRSSTNVEDKFEKRRTNNLGYESMEVDKIEQNFNTASDASHVETDKLISESEKSSDLSNTSEDLPLAELIRKSALKNKELPSNGDLQTSENIQIFEEVLNDLNEKESNNESSQMSTRTTSPGLKEQSTILEESNKSPLLITRNKARRDSSRNSQSLNRSWNRLVNSIIGNPIPSDEPSTQGEGEVEESLKEMETNVFDRKRFEEVAALNANTSQSETNNFIEQSIVAVKSLDINKTTTVVSAALLDKDAEISSRFFYTCAISNDTIEHTIDNTLMPSTVQNQITTKIGDCTMEQNKTLGDIIVHDTLEEVSTNKEIDEISATIETIRESGLNNRKIAAKVRVIKPSSSSYVSDTDQRIDDNCLTATSFNGFDDVIASSTPRFTDQRREPILSVSSIKDRTVERRKKWKKTSVLPPKPIVPTGRSERFSCYTDCLVGLPPRKKRPPLPPIPPVEPVDIIDTLKNGQTAARREATLQRLLRINYLVESYGRTRRFRIESEDDQSSESKSKRRNFKRIISKNLTEISEQIDEI